MEREDLQKPKDLGFSQLKAYQFVWLKSITVPNMKFSPFSPRAGCFLTVLC